MVLKKVIKGFPDLVATVTHIVVPCGTVPGVAFLVSVSVALVGEPLTTVVAWVRPSHTCTYL